MSGNILVVVLSIIVAASAKYSLSNEDTLSLQPSSFGDLTDADNNEEKATSSFSTLQNFDRPDFTENNRIKRKSKRCKLCSTTESMSSSVENISSEENVNNAYELVSKMQKRELLKTVADEDEDEGEDEVADEDLQEALKDHLQTRKSEGRSGSKYQQANIDIGKKKYKCRCMVEDENEYRLGAPNPKLLSTAYGKSKKQKISEGRILQNANNGYYLPSTIFGENIPYHSYGHLSLVPVLHSVPPMYSPEPPILGSPRFSDDSKPATPRKCNRRKNQEITTVQPDSVTSDSANDYSSTFTPIYADPTTERENKNVPDDVVGAVKTFTEKSNLPDDVTANTNSSSSHESEDPNVEEESENREFDKSDEMGQSKNSGTGENKFVDSGELSSESDDLENPQTGQSSNLGDKEIHSSSHEEPEDSLERNDKIKNSEKAFKVGQGKNSGSKKFQLPNSGKSMETTQPDDPDIVLGQPQDNLENSQTTTTSYENESDEDIVKITSKTLEDPVNARITTEPSNEFVGITRDRNKVYKLLGESTEDYPPNFPTSVENEEKTDEQLQETPPTEYYSPNDRIINYKKNNQPSSERILNPGQGYVDRNYPEDDTDDFTYLGKIGRKDNIQGEYRDILPDLGESELYYIGDGVRLPLEIKRTVDGSFALSISKKVCERLITKECPCCVPLTGNIILTPRKNEQSETQTASFKSNRRRRSAEITDDAILSMPVTSFAEKYNLNLKLDEKKVPSNNLSENTELPSEELIAQNYENESNFNPEDLRYYLDYLNQNSLLFRKINQLRTVVKNVMKTEPEEIDGKSENLFASNRYGRNAQEDTADGMQTLERVLLWMKKKLFTVVE